MLVPLKQWRGTSLRGVRRGFGDDSGITDLGPVTVPSSAVADLLGTAQPGLSIASSGSPITATVATVPVASSSVEQAVASLFSGSAGSSASGSSTSLTTWIVLAAGLFLAFAFAGGRKR